MDTIMLRIKKKLKSWESVLYSTDSIYILNHNYKQYFQFVLKKQGL